MSETVQVVRIHHENPAYAGEFVEINASDYNPEKHRLFQGPPVAERQPESQPQRKTTRKAAPAKG